MEDTGQTSSIFSNVKTWGYIPSSTAGSSVNAVLAVYTDFGANYWGDGGQILGGCLGNYWGDGGQILGGCIPPPPFPTPIPPGFAVLELVMVTGGLPLTFSRCINFGHTR